VLTADRYSAVKDLRLRAAQTETTSNIDRMSGVISISFVDFAAFSFDYDRVRCVLMRLFLVRNWCGVSEA